MPTRIIPTTIQGCTRVTKKDSTGAIVTGPTVTPPLILGLKQTLFVTEGHLWPVPKRIASWYNAGGAFLQRSQYFTPAFYQGNTQAPGPGSGTTVYMSGTARPKLLSLGDWPTASEPVLTGKAVTAFRLTVPNRPHAKAAEFVGELRQLPSIPFIRLLKRKARKFRNIHKELGSEYLNQKFGWDPFLKDVIRMHESMLLAKKRVRDFVRNSGKQGVRRRFDFDEETSDPINTSAGVTSPDPVLWNQLVLPGGVLRTSTIQKSKAWFSAKYVYFLPIPGDQPWLNNVKRGEAIHRKLYGSGVDPSTLWNLAPWSWALDYFGNIGENIEVFSRFSQDNLVARYAYIMAKVTVTKSITWSGTLKDGTTINTGCVLTTVLKKRGRCNPYGFAADASLTGDQTAIVAALGLSRSPTRR